MKEWLKLDGESGPYIQYVYARISSMVQKLQGDFKSDYSKLTNQLFKCRNYCGIKL